MMTLRRKLGEPAIIDTVVGSGYRIDPAVLGPDQSPDGHASGDGEAGTSP
jgi:DNA-binding winged helix-turn-helix (wHTH) protein